MMTNTTTWTVTVQLTEEGDLTTARALVDTGVHTLAGHGEAHRNPADSAVPEIGDEFAAGRALLDLGHRLLNSAVEDIEAVEGHPAHVATTRAQLG